MGMLSITTLKSNTTLKRLVEIQAIKLTLTDNANNWGMLFGKFKKWIGLTSSSVQALPQTCQLSQISLSAPTRDAYMFSIYWPLWSSRLLYMQSEK